MAEIQDTKCQQKLKSLTILTPNQRIMNMDITSKQIDKNDNFYKVILQE